MIERISPKFCFATSNIIETKCPISLDNKDINAVDFIPTKSRPKDTGYDVRCAEPDGLVLDPGCFFKMKLGFRMFAPEGWWLSIAPRSGTFINNHIHALYGIIDETYENEMVFAGQYLPDACQLLPASKKLIIPFGQRIAQVLPSPRWEMPTEKISNKEIEELYKERNDLRGVGGFGSSGRA